MSSSSSAAWWPLMAPIMWTLPPSCAFTCVWSSPLEGSLWRGPLSAPPHCSGGSTCPKPPGDGPRSAPLEVCLYFVEEFGSQYNKGDHCWWVLLFGISLTPSALLFMVLARVAKLRDQTWSFSASMSSCLSSVQILSPDMHSCLLEVVFLPRRFFSKLHAKETHLCSASMLEVPFVLATQAMMCCLLLLAPLISVHHRFWPPL
jgi:hypothetical protein